MQCGSYFLEITNVAGSKYDNDRVWLMRQGTGSSYYRLKETELTDWKFVGYDTRSYQVKNPGAYITTTEMTTPNIRISSSVTRKNTSDKYYSWYSYIQNVVQTVSWKSGSNVRDNEYAQKSFLNNRQLGLTLAVKYSNISSKATIKYTYTYDNNRTKFGIATHAISYPHIYYLVVDNNGWVQSMSGSANYANSNRPPYTPIVILRKANINTAPGGHRGEDLHVWSIDEEDPEQVTDEFKQMTPTDYSKTGQTIDYKPTGGENGTVEINAEDIGRTGDAITFSKEDEDLEWKIWGEDGENIYLISSEATTKKLPLSGANGYNNGVYYNDLVASEVYGTTEYKGANARAFKIEDIEYVLDKTSFDITTSAGYLLQEYNIAKNGITFPEAWGEMGESQEVKNRSKQSRLYKGTRTPITAINPIKNYWNFTNGIIEKDYFDSTKLYDLIVTENSSMYWLSSRYAYGNSATDWYFGLMWILRTRS